MSDDRREQWEQCRQRMLRRINHIIDETEQLIRDVTYWHTLPASTDPIDFEDSRVLLSAAKKCREHLEAGTPIPDPLWTQFKEAAGI